MNLQMNTLGNPLTACPIKMGLEISIEPDPSHWIEFIDIPDRHIPNGSISTWTQTWRDCPGLLLTL